MKNSTFSAQVANNLLTLLQGYSKTIRLLLVMFLTLTVTTNAWGADYELVSFSDIKTNDVIIIVGTKSSTAYAMKNTGTPPTPIKVTISNSKITSTATDITFTATNNGDNTITFVSTNSGTLYCTNDNNGVKIGTQTGDNTKFSFDSSVKRLKNIGRTRWLGIYNTQDWRCYTSATATNISGTTTTFYRKVTAAPSFTITATSNNNSYGTVSVSGTTITATPNDGYRVKSGDEGYTVTSGTAVVTNNGDNTFSVTPSSVCTITINFEAIPKYTVTWDVNGDQSVTTQVTEGSKPTFPATPSSCDATSNTFYGWATATWDGKIDNISEKTIYTSANNMPAVNGAVTYYAVFATKGAGGGTAFDGTSGGDFKIYALVEGEKKYLKGTGSKISPVDEAEATEYTFTKISDGVFSIKTGTTYLTYSSSTNLGTSNSSYSWNISEGTKGSWRITSTNSTSRGIIYRAGTTNQFGGYATSNITANGTEYYDVEIGGGSSVSYSGYITTCSGGTPVKTYTVTFNANGHGTAPAAQTITSGETASEPTTPKATGYTFDGWYTEAECTNQFDFNTAITADITLYAKWTIATYTIKATLDHCTSTPEIPDTYEFTGEEINLSYTITPETGYGLPRTITFSGPTYTWDQSTGILTLTGVIKSDVTFTIAAKKIHTITWKVDGEEYTTGDPSTTVLNNEQVSKLPTNPTLDCSGKTFVGWSDQEVSDGNKPSVLFTSAGTSPQILKNTTFHAVFATLTGSGNGQNKTDILTHEINGQGNTNTSYKDFSDKSYTSDAAYAGNSANGNNNTIKGVIQLRSSESSSGIVTTISGGYAKSITIEWNSNTTDGRILDIYGKNEDYSAASDLYDANTRGTKLGSIVKGTSTVLTIDGDYRYIGLRSASNAIYINSISIVWSSSAAPTYTGYTTTCTFTAPALDAPDGLDVEDLTCSSVTLSWNAVDNASSYEVIRTLNGNNTSYPTTETTITIENLEGGNENSWKVRAMGDGVNHGNSDYTTGDNFTTLFSVKYYVDGVIWHGCANGCVDNGRSFDICEETPTKANNTFIGWATTADGEVAYQAGETINDIASNVTLHAVWSDVTYTVNWSVNGEDNPVTYTHGQDLALPSIDITPCDGMDHVGWTDQLAYRHGTDKLFTEASGTVTSDVTYYAVFATRGTSSGETTLDFSAQGYENSQKVTSLEINGITVTFAKGSATTDATYYDNGTAVRVYKNGTFTIASEESTIFKIVLTLTGSETNPITSNIDSYESGTWTGSAKSITFTVGEGNEKYRRIKSITVTSSGGANAYTGHTTTCSGTTTLDAPQHLAVSNIKYNSATFTWDEVEGAISYSITIGDMTPITTTTNTYTTHALKAGTAYTWSVQALGNNTNVLHSQATDGPEFSTYAAVTITWIAGANKTTNTITYGQSIGQALGELPTPATPDGCKDKKTFMGWTTTRKINSDGTNIEYLNAETVPTENTTYYAVFAATDIDGATDVTDVLTHTTINGKESGTSYTEFSSKQYTSDALYAGSSANGNSAIQLRSTNNSGIVTTTSGGSIKSITVEWESHTTAGRTLDIYGKNTAYNDASDLYNQSKQGTLLGSIVYGTSTSLTIDGNYQYIGLRSKSSAMYLTSITIVWTSGNVTYTDYSTSCGDFLVTYYGFNTGYTTICGNPGEITVPQFDTYTIPTCTPTEDPQGLNRTFAGTWVDDKGNSYKPGNSFEVIDDITLYAQWTWNTNTIPTDDEGIGDLATTDIVVTGGNTLTLAEGTTTINSLTLKGGWQADSTYAMPVVNIPEGATLVRNNNKINLDLKVNNNSYYPFAVPFEVTNTSENVNYLDTTLKKYANANYGYGKFYEILEYNGALRAENGVNSKENWVHVGRHTPQKPSYLVPGKGYAISAVPASGQDTVTIRITMTVDNAWLANGEQKSITVKEQTTTRDTVPVTAYTGAAATEHLRHAGWNFVANPYLAKFAGSNVANDVTYIKGSINIQDKYTYEDTEVTYVTVPAHDFSYYEQFKLSTTKLSPAYSFFVQVGTDGTMTFETTGRQQAPASIAARNAEERPVKMDVDLILSDNHSSDQTGIIISDRYSDAYEIGRDLEKLFGSAYNLSVYTLMADNTPLAFQALAIRSNMQVIPVGYRAPEQGEYTFRLNEATSSIDLLNEQYEQLVLVDYQTGELTNLLISDYTFYSERTQADNRFAIYAVPRQNAPTDLPNAIGQDKQAQKIIHNGHLYILRDGNVYNGNGQIVK